MILKNSNQLKIDIKCYLMSNPKIMILKNSKYYKIAKEIEVDDKKKGTNYVMRESESVREIKVSVLVNKDLKSEIEQDF